jgi:hypothetical protein
VRFPLQREHLPSCRHFLKLLPVFWLSQAPGQLAAIIGKPPIFGYFSHRSLTSEPPKT